MQYADIKQSQSDSPLPLKTNPVHFVTFNLRVFLQTNRQNSMKPLHTDQNKKGLKMNNKNPKKIRKLRQERGKTSKAGLRQAFSYCVLRFNPE